VDTRPWPENRPRSASRGWGPRCDSLEANTPLDRLFFTRVNRRVRKDATFSLGADLWEVATHLRGQVITARFDPVGLARMEVWLGERFMGLAVRCDKHRNARIHIVTNDYDREIY